MKLCGECVVDKYIFNSARSCGLYEGALKETIHLFKFEGRRNLAHRLADLLCDTFSCNWDLNRIDLIMPVPLHKKRYKERGFNQSAVLASNLGGACKIAVSDGNLIRVKYTLPQVGLSDKQRANNVRNAFRITHPEKIAGKRVLLIDDVFTTGETIAECARVLLKIGVKEVHALTLARVVGPETHN